MDDKIEVVEKRVKTNIIRRRAKATDAPAPVAEEIKVKPAETVKAAPPKTIVPSQPVAEQAPPTAKVGSSRTVVLDKNHPPQQKVVTVIKAPDVGQPSLAKQKELQELEAKKAKEAIVAENLRNAKQAASGAAAPANGEVSAVDIEDEEDTKKNKAAKKGGKKRGIDSLDEFEGFGRVASVTQLSRLAGSDAITRIFQPSKGGAKKKKIISKKGLKKTSITQIKASKRIVEVDQAITVANLAQQMNVKAGELIKKLMGMGSMATQNQAIDIETATLLAQEFGYEVRDVAFNEEKVLQELSIESEEGMEHRPPVVTIMGHVDHGKTSLLDAIRSANVASGEAGGITQHIGAYTITIPKGKITFLDTPGHAAFTAMRARGASVTDIVVLVVAADDGIMPQTIESIDHARAAEVPIVVAINKIDKPEANLDRIKRQLSEKGLLIEDWGGDVLSFEVSAKTKVGIQELLDGILLQSEVLELRADPSVLAKGVVIESELDKQKGAVATLLVQQGTLKVGDVLVAGFHQGKVRAMLNYRGEMVTEAKPSDAVQILGLAGVPQASDTFNVFKDEQTAAEVVANRVAAKRAQDAANQSKVTLEDFFAKAAEGEVKELPVVLKTDVFGSLEAIREALVKLSTEKVKLKIIHSSVGGINESDVLLASASNAIIIGFNVRPETKAIGTAKGEGVDIKVYKIIYEMVEDVKLAMKGLLAPTRKETYLGRAEVRDTFTVSKIGLIAGCMVIDGKVTRTANLRLLRDNVILFEGKIGSLKRFKDDAKEVAQGMECGVGLSGYQDIKPGDVLEFYNLELIATEL
ncbi:translation initiation factor IF-2 [bacterium]|nr:translation initiation factor IF-2 [bacterium]